ncbi:MAG: silent information regulator protein Sir2 [[Chlorobium] sp. 445]|nr:MAG: silent information regulator protein Sir2 [[Chlorobium] sp. 445]
MKSRVVIFSGAGLSAESGIPTFRDSGGLWENYAIEDVATPEGWQRNPQLVLDFYAARFNTYQACKPNAAHYAIAALEKKYEVINITQNIDNLLERAGCHNVWHLHGRADMQKCERHYDIFADGNPHFRCDFKSTITKPIQWGDRCPKCGAQLRPNVVWFGEAVDMRHTYLDELIETTKIFIVIGTSAQVYPAAGLLTLFADTPQKFFIDPNPAVSLLHGFEIYKDSAATAMPKLAHRLLETQDV